ncbi:MAG: NUDIX hydrolase [Humibacillus sp.]|nr:NUDIX hydrolase [Humibacillus sp.]MDN5779466.1 NUDIX hydrolase [Humibacillus sp.]
MSSVIPAAGTLPWRHRDGRLEVALVHRPKYDDWSWAKGKLDPGELACVAAARETAEETGLQVRLGLPLPPSKYPILDSLGGPATKSVHYWAARVTGGSGKLEHEIDEVAWVDVRTANDRLHYTRDREQLLALVRAEREGDLRTWPLVIVRHAKARPRSHWNHDDRRRPLDAEGLAQAKAIVPVLTAYRIRRVVTSSAVRCVSTVEPFALAAGIPLKRRDSLTEESFADDAAAAMGELDDLLRRHKPAALCTHGPVLPDLLDRLSSHVPAQHHRAGWLTEELRTAADSTMRKGEALVCHVHGSGETARVLGVERIYS